MDVRLIALACTLIILFSMPIDVSDGTETDCVMITDVQPSSSFEGVGITNFGDNDVNVVNYTIEDGEGKITFTQDLILKSHSTIFICKNKPAEWFGNFNSIVYGERGVECKSFALNDNGDEVLLCREGTIVDAFVFGNSDYNGEQWKGSPFNKISKTEYAHRNSLFDTDSATDWILISPGKYVFENETIQYDAEVTPFVFPDSNGIPIMNALSDAKKNVSISIYTITNESIVSILLDKLKNGIEVKILVEGSPAGGIPDAEISALYTLSESGAKVKAIISNDGYKRFEYNHSKYAEIDGEYTITTSENWTESSFNGNIGWGAIIKSKEFTNYFEKVFDNDFSYEYDTTNFTDIHKSKVKTYQKYERKEIETKTYNCKVTPVLSPEYSWDSMKKLISSAEYRIFAEQLEVESSWPTGTDNPLIWMSDRNTDCRLIVNTAYNEIPDMGDLNIAVRNSDDIGYVHNKGIIVDDKVWIGSVNFSENSLRNNRESAVIIESEDVSEFFSQSFMKNWGSDSTDPMSIYISDVGDQLSGKPFIIDASNTYAPENSIFKWDTDEDGIYDMEGKKIVVTLGTGIHRLSLCVTDGELECVSYIDVNVLDNQIDITEYIPLKYIPVLAACAVILAVYLIKKHRGKENVHKRIRSK